MVILILACDKSATRFKEPLTFCGLLVPSVKVNSFLTLLPLSPLSTAASYAIERKASLSEYLADPAVLIDTNHLERALRAIPMGRKNWLFSWTEVGAEYVSKIQWLLVACRMHGIAPYTYFVDLLQRVSVTRALDVADLTPRGWKELFAQVLLTSDLY